VSRQIDKETMEGFVEETTGYLPQILDCIVVLKKDEGNHDALAEARRLFHCLKGAASMVGFAPLGHIAYFAEETLDDVDSGQFEICPELLDVLVWATSEIESYLEGIVSGGFDERLALARSVARFRRLRGDTESGDEEAVNRLLGAPSKLAAPRPTLEDASSDLVDAFQQEADEHLQLIAVALQAFEQHPERKEFLQEVRRSIHTLKGAAGMVGFATVSQLAHRFEDLLDGLYEGAIQVTADTSNLVFATSYLLEDMVRGSATTSDARAHLRDLYVEFDRILGASPDESGSDRAALTPLAPLGEEHVIDLAEMSPSSGGESSAARDTALGAQASGRYVRVPIDRLDELVRLVSELVVSRSSFEQDFRALSRESEEFGLSIDRLRRVTNRIESEYEVSALAGSGASVARSSYRGPERRATTHGFDTLEFDRYTEFHLVSRELAETTGDIGAVSSEIANSIGYFDGFLTSSGRLTSEIQDKLMRLRMIPLASLATRLHRTVRVTAGQKGKAVDLVLEGERVELDKTVLEEVADPLLHLLRNAVDHGIEPPELRRVLGKPEKGTVRLKAYHEATQVVLQIEDDGAGLASQAIRAAIVANGDVTAEEAAELSDQDLFAHIFAPGFTTKTEVSEVSGRGVGLDIVKAAVHAMKGTIGVESTPGRGTKFTIRLPMTLAILRVLLVKSNNETFAVPLAAVTQILRVAREEVETIGREPVIRVDGTVYPVVRLGEALGLKQVPDDTVSRLPVLILNLGDRRVALVAEHLLEARDVVVKSTGTLLRRIHGVSGATLMGDGSVVLILNPPELVRQAARNQSAGKRSARVHASTDVLDILIVDDSVSVRRVLSNTIKSAGWNPVTARDGVEALEIIQGAAKAPDVILLDIEMPRMDGYELTSTLRGHPSYASIPIVMLTSRAGNVHRQKAFDLGVSDYLVKPYQSEVLLDAIRRLARPPVAKAS
jgi:chemosensory pili system protein ChpA (sensor histidine kinase/response regulator)